MATARRCEKVGSFRDLLDSELAVRVEQLTGPRKRTSEAPPAHRACLPASGSESERCLWTGNQAAQQPPVGFGSGQRPRPVPRRCTMLVDCKYTSRIDARRLRESSVYSPAWQPPRQAAPVGPTSLKPHCRRPGHRRRPRAALRRRGGLPRPVTRSPPAGRTRASGSPADGRPSPSWRSRPPGGLPCQCGR
jgi:hypothetical protein